MRVGQPATGYEARADCSDPGVQAHGADQCGSLEDALDGLAGAAAAGRACTAPSPTAGAACGALSSPGICAAACCRSPRAWPPPSSSSSCSSRSPATQQSAAHGAERCRPFPAGHSCSSSPLHSQEPQLTARKLEVFKGDFLSFSSVQLVY